MVQTNIYATNYNVNSDIGTMCYRLVKNVNAMYHRRHKQSDIRNSSKMIKNHIISHSVPKIVFRNVTVQNVF